MQYSKPRKKHSVYFRANIDFSATYKRLEKLSDSGLIDSLDTSRKGKIVFNLRDQDPSKFMISPKGLIECYYYDDPPTAIDDAMARGIGYAYPEWTEIEIIRKKLGEILVPTEGDDLHLEIAGTSVPRAFFDQRRRWRFDPPMPGIGIFGPPVFVCVFCGKEYKSKTWCDKHEQRHNPKEARLSIDALKALSELKRHRKKSEV